MVYWMPLGSVITVLLADGQEGAEDVDEELEAAVETMVELEELGMGVGETPGGYKRIAAT